MKPYLKTCLMALFIMLFSTLHNSATAQPPGNISYQTFYDDLTPYGEWINYPEYGYVWSPRIHDFRPYSTNGQWVWTDEYGWMWASDYDWGWAPFHYGRWLYDDWYGWIWVPGYEWSPGWVEWRTGGDYYGWAPLGPGININISFGRYSPPDYYWNFVPRRYITSPRIYDYCIPYSRNVTIINNTTIINNYRLTNNVFVAGPDRYEVERYTNQRINPFSLRESNRPGRTVFSGNEVNVYRPQVQTNSGGSNYSPRKFQSYDREHANVYQQRNRDINSNNNNNQGGNIFEKRQQQDNGNGFDRRPQQDVREQQPGKIQKQREIEQPQQTQQEQQRRMEQQQQENRNGFERHQQEMQQQEQKRIEQQRQSQQQQQNRNFERQQQQTNPQRGNGNSFERRQPQQQTPQQQSPANGNNNGRAWGRQRKG